MAEKKKTPASRTDEKVDERRAPPLPAAPSPKAPDQAESGGADDGVWTPQKQLAAFEAASKRFHARSFGEAKVLFEQAARGPERDVAHRAQLHAEMCARRLERQGPALVSAEDFYNYGVALFNTGKIAEARESLNKALAMAPNADHIHYALGLAQALSGDLDRAYENLKRAIEIEPRNRLIARQDADLAPLAGQPRFESLLYPERKSW
ncbi:MAG: tetratricopeptide repeat protein [Bryobacteraceae bacterium]|jgi:tetratricopeptide (TPR) repeat protein